MRKRKRRSSGLRFKILKRRVLFSRDPVHLVDYRVRTPSDKVLSRQILEHRGAAVILPKTGKDRYLLIRQYRLAAGGPIWEFPAGGIEPSESVRQSATRELIEEVGLKPRKLTKLVSFYPTPGLSEEIMHLYLAEKLVPARGEQDDDEEIEQREFSLKQIEQMIRRGRIIDGKTILGFFYLKYWR